MTDVKLCCYYIQNMLTNHIYLIERERESVGVDLALKNLQWLI